MRHRLGLSFVTRMTAGRKKNRKIKSENTVVPSGNRWKKPKKGRKSLPFLYMNQYTRSAMGCQPKNPARGVFRARRITELLAARRPFPHRARPGRAVSAERNRRRPTACESNLKPLSAATPRWCVHRLGVKLFYVSSDPAACASAPRALRLLPGVRLFDSEPL